MTAPRATPSSSSTSARSTRSSSPGGCGRRASTARSSPTRSPPRSWPRAAPAGVILSGGPKSVHVPGAPALDPAVYDLGVPVLGICYGAQLVAQQLGGEVARTGRGEYGRTDLPHRRPRAPRRLPSRSTRSLDEPLRLDRAGARGLHRHGQHARGTGRRARARERRIHGVQFHPEVVHTPHGRSCCAASSTTCAAAADVDDGVDHRHRGRAVAAQVGDERVICALSGGVDSAVAAALVHRAVGPPAHVRLRRHRPDAQGRERAGRRDVPPPPGHRAHPRRRRRPLLRAAGRAWPIRRRSARRSASCSSASSRSTPAGSPTPASSCRARSTPT